MQGARSIFIYLKIAVPASNVFLGNRNNISKSVVIIDEAQNAHLNDLKLVLTRIHDDCIVYLIGHSGQYDNFKGENERAFNQYIDLLSKYPWCQVVHLTHNYRGIISTVCDTLGDDT